MIRAAVLIEIGFLVDRNEGAIFDDVTIEFSDGSGSEARRFELGFDGDVDDASFSILSVISSETLQTQQSTYPIRLY